MTGLLHYKASPKRLYILLSLLVIGVFVFRVIQTWQYKNLYGSVDLRNRIVGSRITEHNKTVSPYFYKWNKSDGELYFDIYDTPGTEMNRNTVTPFVLQLLQPVNDYAFQPVVLGWYIAELTALLLIVMLILMKVNDWQQRFFILLFSLIFIGCSQGWLLHNINGQLYIFFALLMAALYYFFTSDRQLKDVLCGLILTVLVLMRPIAAVFILPFLFKRNRKTPAYFLLFAGIYFIQQYIAHEIWLWQDYINAMDEWAIELFKQHQTRDYIDIYKVKSLEGSLAVNPSPYQGLTEDSSLMGWTFRFFNIKLWKEWLLAITAVIYAAVLFIHRKKIKTFDSKKLFVFCFLLYTAAEICLPAIRNSYNYVQWIFPVALILSTGKMSSKTYIALALAGIMALGFLKFLTFDLMLAELIFAAICFYYINTKTTNA